MKSDLSFQLESAGWPAFVVAQGGVIRHANAAAVDLFGPKLEGEGLQLSAIWADQSESAEQFLAHWDRAAMTMAPIKFLGKGGVALTFATYVCSNRDPHSTQKRYVFQLLPTAAAPLPPTTVSLPPALTTPGLSTGPPKARPTPELAAADPGKISPQEATAHKQKLDCALQLVRTVSLDFNNALTGILGHTSLVLSKIEWDHVCRPSLMEVERAAQKAAEIAQQLAAFGRNEKETHGHVSGNLNAVLRRVVDSFQKGKPSTLAWSLHLESQLYAVKFDEAKVQQAFLRIIENAAESLGNAGCIGVNSRNLLLTEPTQDRTAQLPPGAYVCIEFTDDGRGIPEEVLPRVFEPFFSTKHGHRGLGLAWVYGIVTNHRGSVAVSSQPGQWTSVRLYLPASRKRLMESTGHTDLIGNQTILFVDDEELLLATGQAILSSFGYRVLTASSGAQALEFITERDAAIDLVITDLVMPRMTGRELIEQIQLRSPGLPILCTSGCRPAACEENEAYLAKPFTSHELLRRVKQMLAVEPLE